MWFKIILKKFSDSPVVSHQRLNNVQEAKSAFTFTFSKLYNSQSIIEIRNFDKFIVQHQPSSFVASEAVDYLRTH